MGAWFAVVRRVVGRSMARVSDDVTMGEMEHLPLMGGPLLPAQRRQHIIEFLHRHGAVTLQQMASALRVSISTLRRDLDTLADEGLVDRTHGGALLRHQEYSTFEPEFAAALELSPLEKQRIGQVAAEALLPGQSVIFDSGSTVREAAIAAAARNIEILAVTNDIEIAQILGSSRAMRVHVFGGQLRSGSNTLIGDDVLAGASRIRADVLLFGAHAVTEGFVSEASSEVAGVKRALMRAATSKRLLVDSSKFRPRVFMTVCEVSELDEVVTDEGAPRDEVERIRGAGAKLTIARRSH